MSDAILLLLSLQPAGLLLLALCAGFLPAAGAGLAMAGLNSVGAALCVIALALGAPAAELPLPIGPPGMSMHIGIDALSIYVLLLVFTAGCAIGAFQAYAGLPVTRMAICRAAICSAGGMLALLAADGILLTIGLTLAVGALWLDTRRRHATALLIPLLLLGAVALLTPPGFAPRFDAIRTAPPGLMHSSAAVLLTMAAVTGLASLKPAERCWLRQAVLAGLMMPLSAYLLLRLTVELPGAGAHPVWGFLLMLCGGVIAVRQSWCAGADGQIDGIADALVRTQIGLAMTGAGLTVIARLADLPAASGHALADTLLLAAGGLAGTVVVLAVHAVASGAGSYRLSRLGGLVHLMPGTAAALALGLASLTILPPGPGFACLWLLMRALVSAPRTGGLVADIPLAAAAAAVAIAGVLATTAALRLGGVALLSRPRSPRGAGAGDIPRPAQLAMLALSCIPVLLGLLPGPALALLADPILHGLTGVEALARGGPFGAGSAYLALPVAALLGLSTGAALLARRQRRTEARLAGPWFDGAQPPAGLPFGDPLAQSAGEGFLPPLPAWPTVPMPAMPPSPVRRLKSVQTGFWLILAGAAACLIILALTGATE
ncbi:MAG: hypothetical protein B7Z80_07450 [Rhodospirillales bacterium 20-64-7]|nr:MAG: hypothetical protein B7Z80_07450 [Rhodospirillales bacterium 20-64-7]HQT76746.1 hypothetical protein [Rhodopila sp.]